MLYTFFLLLMQEYTNFVIFFFLSNILDLTKLLQRKMIILLNQLVLKSFRILLKWPHQKKEKTQKNMKVLLLISLNKSLTRQNWKIRNYSVELDDSLFSYLISLSWIMFNKLSCLYQRSFYFIMIVIFVQILRIYLIISWLQIIWSVVNIHKQTFT